MKIVTSKRCSRQGTLTNGLTRQLPPSGFLRLSQIVGNQKSFPPVPALIPVSKSNRVGRC